MKLFWQQLYVFWGLNKNGDNVDNWCEQIRPLKENILKVAVRYSVQEDETEREKLRVVREQERVEGTVAWKE